MTAILEKMKTEAADQFVALAKKLASNDDQQLSKEQIQDVLLAAGRSVEELERETKFWETTFYVRDAEASIEQKQANCRAADVAVDEAVAHYEAIQRDAKSKLEAAESEINVAQQRQGQERSSLQSTHETIRILREQIKWIKRPGSTDVPRVDRSAVLSPGVPTQFGV